MSEELATYKSAWTKKTLTAEHYETEPGVSRVHIKLRSPIEPQIGIDLKSSDAVDLAKRILRQFEPEALKPRPFRETVQAGQFFRNKNSGQIVKIVKYDRALFPSRLGPNDAGEHEAFTVKEDGRGMVIVQRPNGPVWVPIDGDQVVEKVSWKFNPNA